MSVVAPFADFSTYCPGGDADFYYSSNPDGYKCSFSVKWLTNERDGQSRYTIYTTKDWLNISSLSTDLITKFLTDISLRSNPGEEADAAESARLLALGDDEESKKFISQVQDRLPIQYVWWLPVHPKYVRIISGNVPAWDPETFGDSRIKMYWDKHKYLTLNEDEYE